MPAHGALARGRPLSVLYKHVALAPLVLAKCAITLTYVRPHVRTYLRTRAIPSSRSSSFNEKNRSSAATIIS